MLGAMLLGWIVSLTILWTKMVGKVNGLGGRVKKVEDSCSNNVGRMDRFERELAEYRRDTIESNKQVGRVEKSVDDLREEIQQANLGLGSQLAAISQSINKMDKNISNRLVRVETLTRVEAKLGPLPEDG